MTRPADDIAKLRELYYRRISAKNLRPLWEVLHTLVPEQPQPQCVAHLWRYADLRPPLIEAGELIFAGTPAGVGAVQAGDRMEGGVEGLDTLVTTIAPAR